MANIVVPDAGKQPLLTLLLNTATVAGQTWRLRLFVNDYTPDDDSETADFTEPVWPGYAFKNLTRGLWTVPVISDHQASSTYGTTPQVFTVDPPGVDTVVYGYFVTGPGDVLLWAQRFDAPVIAGQLKPLPILPQFRAGNLAF